MTSKTRLCIVCHVRPAAVPDRNLGGIGRPIKKVCSECHAVRLKGDIERVLEAHARRKLSEGL